MNGVLDDITELFMLVAIMTLRYARKCLNFLEIYTLSIRDKMT